ncbi:hypothetical protein [Butyricicoccus intestinisimiae]|uniref:Uncharacterized protein n=1 Tax=Butyricicoccus intestinisimiae TaxID=2841509 RepID=A0ABS6EWM8_9FIRM|nr:hypothetical protein [Butyricicoccus intestinisimiae]MBU5491260.1 hypothetical protein [Butyricicoccus intestinisimiae]
MKKIMSIIAVILTATILGGCTAAPAANAEDLNSVPSAGTQEVSIFEPDTAVLDSVPDTIVPDAGRETGEDFTKDSSEDSGSVLESREENAEEISADTAKEDSSSVSDANILRFMQEVAPEMGYTVRVVDSDQLTLRDLEERKDSYVLVERMESIVEDTEGNGRILNAAADSGNYIKFDAGEFNVGDLVETYCVYDNSQYTDTVEMRFDFLVGNVQEITK